MEQNQKNSQLLQVADLGLKRLKNGSLSPEQEAQLNELLKKLDLSFEEAVRAAEAILIRS